jgi:arylamine N-acetyltransferase
VSEAVRGAGPVGRYLAVLGVTARRPGYDALAELTAAYLARIPFENVLKLLHRHAPGAWKVPAVSQSLCV